MKLTLKEMNGLLNGKCLPSDLIVGETLAEYLVRKFAEADAKCAALAAENAGLKSAAKETLAHWAAAEPGEMEKMMDKCMPALRVAYCETPATDAFLAEVRNEAGALAVELFAQTLGSPYSVRDEKCYEDGFTRAIEVVRDIQAPRFAYKIRQAGM